MNYDRNEKILHLLKENAELRKYLKIAIDEADAWHDDDRGGPVPKGENDEFDYARTIINKS